MQGKTIKDTTAVDDSIYIQAGNKALAVTSDSLKKSLLEAIGTQGVEGAITFCNVSAKEITQGSAETFLIKRTALRYRNMPTNPIALNLPSSKRCRMKSKQ